jgi:hypothetical protein
MRRRLAALGVAASSLAGCNGGASDWAHDTAAWAHHVAGVINPNIVTMSDRCAAVMRQAMPFADIDIKSQTAENNGIDLITAHVEGVRTNIPPGQDGALAVECEFNNGVLVSYRWTKGGPTIPGGPAPPAR